MYSLMVVKIDSFTDSADRRTGTSGRTSMGASQRARCYGQAKQLSRHEERLINSIVGVVRIV